MTLTSTQFTSQIIMFFRNLIITNVIDPLATKRAGNEKFVFTSYPTRNVKYPVISVTDANVVDSKRLGMQSEAKQVTIELEIRIWGRNIKEKNEIFDNLYNALQSFDLGADGLVNEGIYNYNLKGTVNIDEEGDEGIKSKVCKVEAFVIVDTTTFPVGFPIDIS